MANVLAAGDDQETFVPAKRRRCRTNRLIITSNSRYYATVMWNNDDTVLIITDSLSYKTTVSKEHINLFVGKTKLQNERSIISYNIKQEDAVEMVVQAPH